jgi:hypothetical protein
MEFLKDGVLYNTETSTKIGEPIQCSNPEFYETFYETLYLSKNKQYYLFITRGRLLPRPTDVEVSSNDEAFRWATHHLSVDTVKKHFSDKIKEG